MARTFSLSVLFNQRASIAHRKAAPSRTIRAPWVIRSTLRPEASASWAAWTAVSSVQAGPSLPPSFNSTQNGRIVPLITPHSSYQFLILHRLCTLPTGQISSNYYSIIPPRLPTPATSHARVSNPQPDATKARSLTRRTVSSRHPMRTTPLLATISWAEINEARHRRATRNPVAPPAAASAWAGNSGAPGTDSRPRADSSGPEATGSQLTH